MWCVGMHRHGRHALHPGTGHHPFGAPCVLSSRAALSQQPPPSFALQLLENHPWMETHTIGASERSAGKAYDAACAWKLNTPMPKAVAKMKYAAKPFYFFKSNMCLMPCKQHMSRRYPCARLSERFRTRYCETLRATARLGEQNNSKIQRIGCFLLRLRRRAMQRCRSIVECDPKHFDGCDIIFSALDANIAGE